MDLTSDLWIITALFWDSADNSKEKPEFLRVPLVYVRAYRFKYFILTLQNIALVILPVFFEVTTSLLVDLLLYIEVSLV